MIFTFDYLFYLLECFCLDVKQNILFLSCIYIYIYIYIYILQLQLLFIYIAHFNAILLPKVLHKLKENIYKD